jgi:phytoene dehydrogenase-like protein
MLSNALKKERAVGSRCSDPSAPWSLLPHEGTNTMPDREALDAIVVGAGPNGLAAAITLAQAGLAVRVYEARDRPGGGVRSAELTLPGFTHDVCSAIHPLGVGSPFFRTLPLDKHGLEWIQAPAALAHPFDDGTAALLERSVEMTSETLGEDARAYRRLMSPLVADWGSLGDVLLGPMRFPRHPFVVLRFGWRAIRSAHHLAEAWFKTERARGFFAGLAAHAIMPLEKVLTSAFGLLLGMLGHVVGWPFPRGGAQQITDALVSYFRGLGGELVTNAPIGAIDELPPARAILLDVTPLQLLQLAGKRLPAGYRHRLARYRYGPGVFKVDWALDGPIPWRSALCTRAGTVHVGGMLAEIAAAERAVWRSEHAERPFVLVAQQSLFDPTRAPSGKQVAWGYCHVPNGSMIDMTASLERQIERFAPGFRERILARSVLTTAALERYNPNYIGGDINGGVQDLWQLYARPAWRLAPYATPVQGLYICSASTPPGGGVHGMCGYHAARTALRLSFQRESGRL